MSDKIRNFDTTNSIPVRGKIFDMATRDHRSIASVDGKGDVIRPKLVHIRGVEEGVLDDVFSRFVEEYLLHANDPRLEGLKKRLSEEGIEDLELSELEVEILAKEYKGYLIKQGVAKRRDFQD